MRKKIIIVCLALMLISVLGASITSANVKTAETGDYDSINGKKLLFYGEVIYSIHIRWWNSDNISEFTIETHTDINLSSYIFTITNEWNCNFIQWEATITDTFSNMYYFEGGFPCISLSISDLTDYNKIQNMQNNLKSDIISWILGNQTYGKKFNDIEENVVTSIDNLVSAYNDGIVAELKSVGLTNTQITEIMSAVDDGFEDTLRSQDDQDLAIARAEERGWWSGASFVFYALILITIVGFVFFYFRGSLNIPTIKRKQPSSDIVDTELNFDIFK